MRSELSRYSDGLRTTLVISANTSATETLASSVIVDFMADNPDIDLELEERPSHEIVAAVTDGRAELGIIADTVDSGRLERAVLRPDKLVVIVRPDHALARGSFESAQAAIERATGVHVGKRQIQDLAVTATADSTDFYTGRRPGPAGEDQLLILTLDGKGVVMRPEALREATAKARCRQPRKLGTRLSPGEKNGRKRMAELPPTATPAQSAPEPTRPPPTSPPRSPT